MEADMTELVDFYRECVKMARRLKMPVKEMLICLELIRQIKCKEVRVHGDQDA